jgi:hypothetical protein
MQNCECTLYFLLSDSRKCVCICRTKNLSKNGVLCRQNGIYKSFEQFQGKSKETTHNYEKYCEYIIECYDLQAREPNPIVKGAQA